MSEHELWNELGKLYFKTGEYEDAIKAYNKAIKLAPRFGWPYSNLALTYARKFRYQEAILLYRKSIELLNDDLEKAVSWNRLGLLYLGLKDYDNAIAAFRTADDLDPNHALFRDGMGEMEELPFIPAPGLFSGEVVDKVAVEELVPADADEIPAQESQVRAEMPLASTMVAEATPGSDLLSMGLRDSPAVVEIEDLRADQAPSETNQTCSDVSEESVRMVPETIPESDLLSAGPGDNLIVEEPEPVGGDRVPAETIPVGDEPVEPEGHYSDWQRPFETQSAGEDGFEYGQAAGALFGAWKKPEPALLMNEQAATKTELLAPVTSPSSESALLDPSHPVAQELQDVATPYWTFDPPADQESEPAAMDEKMPSMVGDSPSLELDAQPAELPPASNIEEPADSKDLSAGTAFQDQAGDESTKQEENEPSQMQESAEKLPQKDVKNDDEDYFGQIAKFERVVEINPKNAFAWDTLGNLHKSAGHYEAAISAYEQAISVDSTKAFHFYHLGLVYAAQKRYDDAVNAFNKVLELDPGYSLAHATLAGYYRKLGQEAKAQRHIKIASESMQDENEYNLACFEAICGNADRAIELLRVALENKQITQDWARRDPDLEFIREDPQFKVLVGEA